MAVRSGTFSTSLSPRQMYIYMQIQLQQIIKSDHIIGDVVIDIFKRIFDT